MWYTLWLGRILIPKVLLHAQQPCNYSERLEVQMPGAACRFSTPLMSGNLP